MANSGSQKASTSTSSIADHATSLASVPDDELDAYIADLILQKSRAKEISSHKRGISAYLKDEEQQSEAGSGEVRVPNTNKRFLASVIRNVEGHNQALLRQQARQTEPRSSLPESRACNQERVISYDQEASNTIPSMLRRGSNDDASPFDQDRLGPASLTGRRPHGERIARDPDGSSSLHSRTNKHISDPILDQEATLASAPRRYTENRSRYRDRDRDRSERSRKEHREPSGRKSDRQSSAAEERRQPSKSSSSSRTKERHRSDHSDRRHRHETDRDRKRSKHDADRGDLSKRRRKGEEGERKKGSRSGRKEDDSKRGASSSHKRDLHQRGTGSDRRSETKASPIANPPQKIREWDLGKHSLAF